MKKQFLAFLLLACLVIPASSSIAWMQMGVGSSGVEEADTCPSFGASALFAWDGGHSSGNTYACYNNNASTVNGVNTGGDFSGTGSDTIWTLDNDDEKLEWAINSSIIDHDASGGITVCMEIKINGNSGVTYIYEFEGNDGCTSCDDDWIGGALSIADNPRAYYYSESGDADYSQKGLAVTDDDSTWHDVAFTWKVGEALNDHAADNNADGYEQDDEDMVAWTDGENAIRIGNDIGGTSITDLDIRRFVVLSGYTATCPSW